MRPRNFESSPQPRRPSPEGALLHDGDGADFHSPYKSENLLPYDQLKETANEAPYVRPEKVDITELKSVRVGDYTRLANHIRSSYLQHVPSAPEGATQADYDLAGGE